MKKYTTNLLMAAVLTAIIIGFAFIAVPVMTFIINLDGLGFTVVMSILVFCYIFLDLQTNPKYNKKG